VKPGINDALVELIDFYATVEDLTGMKPTHTHFGKSLRNVMAGETQEHREAVYCEGGRLKQEIHCNESYHYPGLLDEHSEYYPRISLQTSQGPEHTKATMLRTKDYKYVKRLYEKDELYDVKQDKENLRNLIDDPAYKDTVIEMKDRMLSWLQETADVVPFKEDERMSKKMILSLIKNSVPLGQYLLVKIALRSGMSVADLMSMADKRSIKSK
jgi:arylsulfatase A-like enzyme